VFITRAHTCVNDVSVSSSVLAEEMKRCILHSGCYIKPLVSSRPDKNTHELKKKLAASSGIKTKVNISMRPVTLNWSLQGVFKLRHCEDAFRRKHAYTSSARRTHAALCNNNSV
jgi:hypothetical protein